MINRRRFVFPNPFKALTDKRRITTFKQLIAEGHGHQIVVSHDSLTTEIMAINGGPGILYALVRTEKALPAF